MDPVRPEFDAPVAPLDEANRRARAAEHELARLRDELERRVAERTAELAAANDALRASEGRLRGFFDTATVAMLEIAPDGRYLRVNAAFYRMFGYTPDELPGLTMRDVVYPEDWERVWADFGRVVRGELVAYEADRRYRRKDGSPVHARVSVVAGGGAGAPAVLSSVVIDLTERRRLEDGLRQAAQLEAVGRLAGGVAHDFNNLLTVINGYADELLTAAPPGDPRRDALAAIRDAGARAAALTGQLLAFGRKSIVEPRVLDLNDTIDGLTGLLGRAVGPGVLLTITLAPGLHRVKADPTQVEQVLVNLAMNARDAMPAGGRLIIETESVQLGAGAVPDLPPGPYVRLTVSDTGRGIPEDVLPHVFEPFFPTTGSGRGTGLGLATVYGIAKAHGGHAAAASTPGGSTFTVLLPATLERPAPRSGELRLGPRGNETILVAEDDDTIRRLMRVALEANGYAVLDGGFGSAALDAADGHPGAIHLLVTDLMMPGLNGRELADALRARRPGVKVLYVSGYTDDAGVRSAIESAADAFLPKPFNPLVLAAKVRAVLDGM